MKKNSFLLEFIRSFPFKVFAFLVITIVAAVMIHKCNDDKKRMKEDTLYIHPRPGI
jgi:hypothetical protein